MEGRSGGAEALRYLMVAGSIRNGPGGVTRVFEVQSRVQRWDEDDEPRPLSRHHSCILASILHEQYLPI